MAGRSRQSVSFSEVGGLACQVLMFKGRAIVAADAEISVLLARVRAYDMLCEYGIASLEVVLLAQSTPSIHHEPPTGRNTVDREDIASDREANPFAT